MQTDKMRVFTEENAKQITLPLLFCGKPQKLAGISATQGSPVHLSWPGNPHRFFVAACNNKASPQPRLISQCHLLLSSSLLHWNPSMDTFLRHYCQSKGEIT